MPFSGTWDGRSSGFWTVEKRVEGDWCSGSRGATVPMAIVYAHGHCTTSKVPSLTLDEIGRTTSGTSPLCKDEGKASAIVYSVQPPPPC